LEPQLKKIEKPGGPPQTSCEKAWDIAPGNPIGEGGASLFQRSGGKKGDFNSFHTVARVRSTFVDEEGGTLEVITPPDTSNAPMEMV